MRQKRMLVVDDIQDKRRILIYQLRKIVAFHILEAAPGQEALEIKEKLERLLTRNKA